MAFILLTRRAHSSLGFAGLTPNLQTNTMNLKLTSKVSIMRQVLIYSGEDGYWVAECPSLPGCISQGKTKAEAIDNIKEAISVYIMALEEDHLSIPEEHFDSLLLAV